MTSEQVISLMKSSKTVKEWNANCDKVKAAFNGQYPSYWYELIILSGLFSQVTKQSSFY